MTQDNSNQEPEGRPLARHATVDIFVSALTCLVGIVVIVQARRLGAEWTSDGPGAGYFPFYIGLVLAVCGAAICVQSLRKRGANSTFVDSVQFKRVLSVLLPSVVYAGAIMALGMYVASALFVALFMVILGKYSALKSAIVGLAVNALLFAMFEVWFKVPLYKGALDPLHFLGY